MKILCLDCFRCYTVVALCKEHVHMLEIIEALSQMFGESGWLFEMLNCAMIPVVWFDFLRNDLIL